MATTRAEADLLYIHKEAEMALADMADAVEALERIRSIARDGLANGVMMAKGVTLEEGYAYYGWPYEGD